MMIVPGAWGFNRLILVIWVLVILSPPAFADKSPYDWALIQLDHIREERTDQLTKYMAKLHQAAQKARTDETVSAFFEMNRLYFDACRSQEPPRGLARDIDQMRQHFNSHYIRNYLGFYDILFINIKGEVFYTLRKEADTCRDMIPGTAGSAPLETAIRSRPDHEVFIDYHDYPPSSEPAAFFIEPVRIKGRHVGWLALQCSITKLNSIFAATSDLGHTGETFLVNRGGLMLTESYFKGESTILKTRLDNRNVNAKFAEKKGHRVVTDYRGAMALTAFEVFEFMGTGWLVVAKIDRDEVTTRHYQRHGRYYFDRMVQRLKTRPPVTGDAVMDPDHSHLIRVDMDEFIRGRGEDRLETWGVSTCTALVAAVPKKFAYLAHISPQDRVYGQSGTDLLSQITRKVKNFEIYPCEKRTVRFSVIAPHFEGLARITDQLIREGFMLSQIYIGFYPDARAAALQYHCRTSRLIISWSFDPRGAAMPAVSQEMNALVQAGSLVEAIMAEDEKNPPVKAEKGSPAKGGTGNG